MTTLEAALKRMVKAPLASAESLCLPTPFDVDAINSKLELLRKHQSELFGVESDSVQHVKREINILEVAAKRPGVKLLDPSVFTWRWRQQLRRGFIISRYVPIPKLALLSLKSSICALRVDDDGRWLDQQQLPLPPAAYLAYCTDIKNALHSISKSNRGTASIRFQWKGHIPANAREIIHEAVESKIFDEVHLLAEAPKDAWRLMENPGPPRQWFDPLILGRRNDLFFVLGKFDPTTLEAYIAEEFIS